jgi:hypothetical protein
MFLKKKRYMSIKAQMCANGQGQCSNWAKKDTKLPTVAAESVFITAVMNTHRGCNATCFDIPGAFLHSDTDEDNTMILKGTLAELMVQALPNLYRKLVYVNRKRTPILYVKMQKGISGLLKRALLFYRKLVADLKKTGFVLNPYDLCVANKDINEKQTTVCWHVDDLKVSQMEPAEITKFREWLLTAMV